MMKLWMQDLMKRRIWIICSILLLILELYVLLGTPKWLGEDRIYYLTGTGSYILEESSEPLVYIQEFIPQHSYLKSISLLFQNRGMELKGGEVTLLVLDENDELLLKRVLPYEQLTYGRYTDIELNLPLQSGHVYYLSVNCGQTPEGHTVGLGIQGYQETMEENVALYVGDILPDSQLVTRYHYGKVLAPGTKYLSLLCCILTALGLAIGLPKSKKIRYVFGSLVLLVLPLLLGCLLESLAQNGDTSMLLPFAMKWNIGLMYLLEIVILLVTCSFGTTIILTDVLLTIIYSANYYVWIYRSSPLRWNDVLAAKTAMRVVGNYNLRPSSQLAFIWCVAVLFLTCGIILYGRVSEKQKREKKYWISRLLVLLAGVGIAAGSGYMFFYTDFLEQQGFVEFHGMDEYYTYHYDGFFVATLINLKASRIEKPQGYSVEKAEEILHDYDVYEDKTVETESLPHVILIMNESLSDLRILGNLELSEENLPYISGLTENTIKGWVNASVLGGGTANSEFEVFTGCSMGLLPEGYYPYQQVITKPKNSLVSEMTENGYTTYAIHPAYSTNWNRDRVYEYLGFENCIWQDEFENAEEIHYGISDRETYNKVKEIFAEKEEGEKLFIFDLTIQNHGGYGDSGNQSVTAVNVSSTEADTYLSLMKESDAAFGELVDYFRQYDEKVVICMFGDHQPKFADSGFYDSVYAQTEELSDADKLLNLYKTPFVIWANYDIAEGSDWDISMNYLGGVLLDTVGISQSPYFQFLDELRSEYPIITTNGYVDAQGNYSAWSGGGTEFPEYRILQYYYLFDSGTEAWGF